MVLKQSLTELSKSKEAVDNCLVLEIKNKECAVCNLRKYFMSTSKHIIGLNFVGRYLRGHI